MATSFRGWGSSWAGAWGPIAVDPNAMIGAAGFTLTAIATLTSGAAPADMSGAASLTFSAIGILTDPNAYAERRPKSTNTLKLQRIQEGRATLLHASNTTRARVVTAKGFTQAAVVAYVEGASRLLSGTTRTRNKSAQAMGRAVVTTLGACTTTHTTPTASHGAAATHIDGGRLRTCARQSNAAGRGEATLRPHSTMTLHDRVVARGVRNLTDTEIAAIAVQVTLRRHARTFA